MQHEADAIFLELTSPPSEGVEPMGIDTPLVDREGYPRGDIDIYRARTLRQRFRVLQTDHKETEQEIENLLQQLAVMKNPRKTKEQEEEQAARLASKPKPKYDPITGKWVVKNWDGTVAGVSGGEQRRFDNLAAGGGAEAPTTTTSTATTTTTEQPQQPQRRPFARIDLVTAGSPADLAGLEQEDLIVEFGPLHAENHNQFRAIAELVQRMASEQRAIPITLLRRRIEEQTLKKYSLLPRPWSGRGLIGCHIVPYTSEEY